jgi:hypothetical protein
MLDSIQNSIEAFNSFSYLRVGLREALKSETRKPKSAGRIRDKLHSAAGQNGDKILVAKFFKAARDFHFPETKLMSKARGWYSALLRERCSSRHERCVE